MTRTARLAILAVVALIGLGATRLVLLGPPEGEALPPPAASGAELVTLDLNREVTAADVAAFNPPRSTPREVVRTILCGAPTKSTGQPCRNKVRGGGPCWRHR
jgi:hypothetical protein